MGEKRELSKEVKAALESVRGLLDMTVKDLVSAETTARLLRSDLNRASDEATELANVAKTLITTLKVLEFGEEPGPNGVASRLSSLMDREMREREAARQIEEVAE